MMSHLRRWLVNFTGPKAATHSPYSVPAAAITTTITTKKKKKKKKNRVFVTKNSYFHSIFSPQ